MPELTRRSLLAGIGAAAGAAALPGARPAPAAIPVAAPAVAVEQHHYVYRIVTLQTAGRGHGITVEAIRRAKEDLADHILGRIEHYQTPIIEDPQ